MSELHTLVKCAHCERGVRNQYSVRGYCSTCAEELLDVTDKLLAERNRVVDVIPDCPVHGPQCVPHAVEWVEKAQAELERLRRIEAAVMSISLIPELRLTTLEAIIAMWRLMEHDAPPVYARVCKAIADALEAK